MRLHLRLPHLHKSPPAPVKPVPKHDPTDDHMGARLDDSSRRLTARAVIGTSLGFLALVAIIAILLAAFSDRPESAHKTQLETPAAHTQEAQDTVLR